jgi:hypothetical protein
MIQWIEMAFFYFIRSLTKERQSFFQYLLQTMHKPNVEIIREG